MPGSLFVKEEVESSGANTASYSSTVTLSALNRDGSRSAFSPYRPTTVLTNLQRGNVQTQTLSVLPERSIHQLAAQGELFIPNSDDNFDVDERDQNGFTPLMWASGYGQLETVRKLLSFGASITSIGSSGENSLILASASGHSMIVKELINNGSALDYKDPDGNTALMYAAYNNHAGCVQELLNAGADMTLTNEALDSAFDIAVKKRSKNAQAIIEKHMLNLLQPNVHRPV